SKKLFHSLGGPPALLVYGSKSEHPEDNASGRHPERKSSRERPALRRARHRRSGHHGRASRRPVAPRRLRTRPHQHGARRPPPAPALLRAWGLVSGRGAPRGSGVLFGLVAVVPLLALAAALAPHVGPFRLPAPQPDVRRTSRIRLLLSVSYLIVTIGFVGYHL